MNTEHLPEKKPRLPRKGTARRKLRDLYHHVTGVCGHEPSEVIREMWKVVEQGALHPWRKRGEAFGALSLRFNTEQPDPWTCEGNAMVQIMDCEWRITNADLECWADFCLFGARDYFPNGEWSNLANGLRSLLHDTRRYQSLVRYREGGGVRRHHRRLLAKCGWGMDLGRGDWVSLYVEGKHPLGDSAREWSMFDALGWKRTWGDEEDMPTEMEERLWDLWDELPYALHAILSKP